MTEKRGRIAVIGAGSTGSSVAYHLAEAGFEVVLVEREQVAMGMTSRSTAVVRTHYSHEIVARMALFSLAKLRASASETGFVNSGMVILSPDAYRKMVEANVSMLRKAGVNEQVLERREAERAFPEVDFSGADYIAYEPESGYADPVSTANWYASRAREMGAKVVTGTEAVKIGRSGGEVESVRLSDGTVVACSRVVLCTNIWTNRILARSGVPAEGLMPIRVVPHPVVVYRRPEGYQGKKTIVSDYVNKSYYKPEGKYLLFGGSIDAELDSVSIEIEDCPSEVSYEYLTEYSGRMMERIPAMKEASVQKTYYGMYDTTPDEQPILDDLSGVGLKGAYACVGLSGHGFKLCPAFGTMVKEMVTGVDGPSQTFDRAPFSLSRFEKGALMATRYAGLGSVA